MYVCMYVIISQPPYAPDFSADFPFSKTEDSDENEAFKETKNRNSSYCQCQKAEVLGKLKKKR